MPRALRFQYRAKQAGRRQRSREPVAAFGGRSSARAV